MSLPFNIIGSLFLIGGSAWSIIKFLPKKEYRYRVWANVLIIVGTLVIAGAGSMARAGMTKGLYIAEMIASAILLAGFLMAGTLDKGSKAAVAASREQRAAAAGTAE
jgi:low affinity Fe/Cu permease